MLSKRFPIKLFLAGLQIGAVNLVQANHDSLKTQVEDTTRYEIRSDDPVLAAIDSLWNSEKLIWQDFEPDTNCLNVFGFKPGEIPVYHDSVYIERLAALNEETPLNLDYNRYVRAFINLYAEQRRDVTRRVLGLAELYYPMFEEKLDKFDMPLELKHLAVVESALNPSAKSWVGATGLWQFMYSTGKMYGLNVNSFVDERRDPYESTIAACRYMSRLYEMYGDWNLVLAAYNSGPGNVNKAIRRSGGHRDYWKIRPYLPRETRGYVPAFIAVNYIMNYAEEHNLYAATPLFFYADFDTLHVCRRATFDQITHFTGVSTEELEILNPSLKRNIIPGTGDCYTLYLPQHAVGSFLVNQDRLHNYYPDQPQSVDGYIIEDITETYTVRSGDVLGVIAQRHGVSITSLREWNNIRGNRIYPNQKLVIHRTVKTKVEDKNEKTAQKESTEPKKEAPVSAQKTSGTKSAGKKTSSAYHIVQKGDTLWDIAKMYPGISVNDIRLANNGLNSKRLKPGQKIKIPPKI